MEIRVFAAIGNVVETATAERFRVRLLSTHSSRGIYLVSKAPCVSIVGCQTRFRVAPDV
jgi:hypothetical protein